MKVVFRDSLACQHVLRILSGNTELRVEAKETYKDGISITYINADLSKRVHFLKCEEEGKAIMCKVTDELIEIGKEIGEERSTKKSYCEWLIVEKR